MPTDRKIGQSLFMIERKNNSDRSSAGIEKCASAKMRECASGGKGLKVQRFKGLREGRVMGKCAS